MRERERGKKTVLAGRREDKERHVLVRVSQREKWSRRSFPYNSTYMVCAEVGLLWKHPPPLSHSLYQGCHDDRPPLLVTTGLPTDTVHRSRPGFAVCGARAPVHTTLSRTYYVPMGTASRFGVAMETASRCPQGSEMGVKEG